MPYLRARRLSWPALCDTAAGRALGGECSPGGGGGGRKARVAVVGLGAMGSRIAVRLLDAGHQVSVWNRSAAKLSPLVSHGAVAVATPAQAAGRAEALITMVSGPQALRAVTDGPDGIASGARPALTVIEMSTVGPAAVAELASSLPAGTGLVDAPVMGSLAEAESGTLVIFAGGPAERVEQISPLLSALGSTVHTGPLGSGAAAKLVANAAHLGTVGMLGETIALARALGLPPETTYQILAATPLAAQAKRRRPAIEAGAYPPRFLLALARKDAHLINQAAEAAGADLRLTAAMETWLADAERAGMGNRDYTAILEVIPRGGRGCAEQSAPDPDRAFSLTPGCFDGLIVDLDGVVWLGGDPIAGAAHAIATLRTDGIRVLFVTNEPLRSRAAIATRLTEIGIPATPADVVTSAAAAAHAAASLPGLQTRRALVIGPPALHDEISSAGFHLVECERACLAEVVVVAAHEGFDYRELRAASAAVRNGARLFATGRDPVFPTATGMEPATGAITAAVETAGGMPAVVAGKPGPVMFEIARKALPDCERIAVIGDSLEADIAGAKRVGLAAILVLTGTTTQAELERALVRPDLVLDSLASVPAAISASPATDTLPR